MGGAGSEGTEVRPQWCLATAQGLTNTGDLRAVFSGVPRGQGAPCAAALGVLTCNSRGSHLPGTSGTSPGHSAHWQHFGERPLLRERPPVQQGTRAERATLLSDRERGAGPWSRTDNCHK